jgi:hypothetical protein
VTFLPLREIKSIEAERPNKEIIYLDVNVIVLDTEQDNELETFLTRRYQILILGVVNCHPPRPRI